MKKLILFFITFFFILNLSAQSSVYDKKIYKDYGTWKIENNGNVISIHAFCTVSELPCEDGNQTKQKDYNVSQKYCYEFYLVSKSIFNDDTTNTWLYDAKIYVNGVNMMEKQFPDGFVISVKTEPTLIHSHHTTEKNIDYHIKWENSVYEPRIRK